MDEGDAPLRILHIYKDYDPVVGGIENHLKVLAEGLVQAGHAVTVLATNTARATVAEERNGVRVVKAGRTLHIASTPLSTALLGLARREQCDIVHLHMPYPPGDLALRAVPGDPALVVTYHSDIVRQRKLLRLYSPLLRATLRRADRIIATSDPYIQSSPFLRRHAAKCRVVPLSVDGPRFGTADAAQVAELRRSVLADDNATGGAPPRADGCVILSVGVLRYYKGLPVLLDALTEVDATLVVVGTGPEEQQLRDLAQAYGVARRVHFAGAVPDELLPAYYAAADVFVLPSQLRAEAFGIVLLEAMAAGLPVISTELGTGTSAVNQHGQSGFVVDPGDPHGLARALDVLLANVELRRKLGAYGRRRALSEYTPGGMIARTLAVYREALGR